MKDLVEKLKEFKESLEINTNVDWNVANPVEEFESLNKLMSQIIEEAEGKILSPRDEAIEKLGHYVSEDDVEEAYDKLLEQAEIDDQVMADDVVCMWEPLEFRFSVSLLLEQIS